VADLIVEQGRTPTCTELTIRPASLDADYARVDEAVAVLGAEFPDCAWSQPACIPHRDPRSVPDDA
jgi:hypothetical protein